MFKVLVVDDSRLERDAFSRLLAGAGYSVSTAESGKIGWTMLYADLPDLIVLDLMMPEMSGITFLRMLRGHHHWQSLPVMVVTGLEPDEAIVEAARELGVVYIFHKGSDSVDLLLARIGMTLPSSPPATRARKKFRQAVSHLEY